MDHPITWPVFLLDGGDVSFATGGAEFNQNFEPQDLADPQQRLVDARGHRLEVERCPGFLLPIRRSPEPPDAEHLAGVLREYLRARRQSVDDDEPLESLVARVGAGKSTKTIEVEAPLTCLHLPESDRTPEQFSAHLLPRSSRTPEHQARVARWNRYAYR
jgi:hypothetical protein